MDELFSVPRRSCCSDGSCPRAEIDALRTAGESVERRVHFAASRIANTCGSLTAPELRYCFGVMFHADPQCRLFDEFRFAYQTERDALDGVRLIQVKSASASGE